MSAFKTITVAVCGHISHGKSTLVGRIVYDKGQVDPARMKLSETFLAERGSRSRVNRYSALVFRDLGEEGERGQTVFSSHVRVKLNGGRVLTIVDTPGHVDFKRQRAYGVFAADVAVLVVGAALGEGVEQQTIEALRIMHAHKTPLAGVVVTKIDTVDSDLVARVQEIECMLSTAVKEIGVSLYGGRLQVVSCSALYGHDIDPVLSLFENISWEPTQSGPLRICVEGSKEVFSIKGIGTVVAGVIESGRLEQGDNLVVEPASCIAGEEVNVRVKGMQLSKGVNEAGGSDVKSVGAREMVSLLIDTTLHKARAIFSKGAVLVKPSERVDVVDRFVAEIEVFSGSNGVRVGSAPFLIAHTVSTPCRIEEIQAVRSEGEAWQATNAGVVRENQFGRVIISLHRPVPFDLDNSRLSRFSLRAQNSIVAIGSCREIVDKLV